MIFPNAGQRMIDHVLRKRNVVREIIDHGRQGSCHGGAVSTTLLALEILLELTGERDLADKDFLLIALSLVSRHQGQPAGSWDCRRW